MEKFLMTTVVLAVVFCLVLVTPFAVIWSLNTLFPALAIAYNLDTLVAAFIITAILTSKVKTK